MNFFFLINSAYCQEEVQEEAKERSYSLSFTTQFGFVHGQAFEYVYPVNETKNDLLSELTWDMKPVFYYGFKLDFCRADLMSKPGFFTSLSFKTGVPGDSGVMEDRDWLYRENASLTRFSSHTNKTEEFYWFDAFFGASIPLNKIFIYITPFISGSWMHFSFTGRDGYRIYDDLENPYGIITGEVIHYSQDWFLLAAGFITGTRVLFPFTFEISFQISPLSYCAATDDHLGRNIVFKDFTGLGLFLEPGCGASFTWEKLELSLAFSYRHIERTKGESYSNANNRGFILSQNKAGAGLALTDLSFLTRLRI